MPALLLILALSRAANIDAFFNIDVFHFHLFIYLMEQIVNYIVMSIAIHAS